MKKLIVIAVLGALGFYGYRNLWSPAEIANPVYAEIRVRMDVLGREIEAAVFGKMLDDADCQQRGERVKSNLDANCPFCVS